MPSIFRQLIVEPVRWLFGYRGIPRMSRSTFRRELISTVSGSLGAALLMPPFMQLFAKTSLGAPDWLVPLYFSGPMAIFLLASMVAQMLRRHRRIPCMVASRWGIALCLGVVALLPAGRFSLPVFTAAMLVAALLVSVGINIQAGVWHSNYPGDVRGRIFSRLIVFRMTALAGGAQLAGVALDHWTQGHHLVYALAAGCFFVSGWGYSRIRIRREAEMIRQGVAEPLRLLAGMRILRIDRPFRWYMTLQFLAGGLNMMIRGGILVLAFRDVFHVDYKVGAAGLVLIPSLLQVLGSPASGLLFDRMGVMRFRGLNSFCWALAFLLLFWGLRTGWWAGMIAGFVFCGLGQATGMIGWNLAHTRFAPPGQGQLYMGAHLTLTGLRGAIMPYLGTVLYYTPLGLNTIAWAAGVTLLAALGFFLTREPGDPEAPE
jgi:MFS family permease